MSSNQKKYKYPRTFHLPWSQGLQSDDKLATDLDFLNKEIVVTEKLDGSNFTLYSDYLHARSLDGVNHESFAWIKQFHAGFKYFIPEGYRLCGEYVYAKHSIHYTNLESYFYLFSIWNEDTCLSWRETEEFAATTGLHLVPVIYKGYWNDSWESFHKTYWNHDENKHEGYVIRNTNQIKYENFSSNIAKYVRANHVQTSEHWKNQKVVKNKLNW
jgi:hypothetical protein